MENFFKRFLKPKGDGEDTSKPTSLESMLDVPSGVTPAYFSEILHYLESNNFDQSVASASIIRNLGIKSMKTGEYASFTDTTLEEAKRIALDPLHPVHDAIKSSKETSEKSGEALQPKRKKIEKAYGETFDPDQQFVDLGDEDDNEGKGGTRID